MNDDIVINQVYVFLDICNSIFKPNPYLGDELYLYEERKFYYIRGNNFTEPSPPKGYIFAKVNKITGDIYSEYSSKPKGSIFSKNNGAECINLVGVLNK